MYSFETLADLYRNYKDAKDPVDRFENLVHFRNYLREHALEIVLSVDLMLDVLEHTVPAEENRGRVRSFTAYNFYSDLESARNYLTE